MSGRWLTLTAVLLILIVLTIFFRTAPPSPVYLLKITRESLQSYFIFGDEDKAFWALTKAEKRITEAEYLKSKNMNYLADKQVKSAKDYQLEADIIIANLKDKVDRNYLIDKNTQVSDRIKALEL